MRSALSTAPPTETFRLASATICAADGGISPLAGLGARFSQPGGVEHDDLVGVRGRVRRDQGIVGMGCDGVAGGRGEQGRRGVDDGHGDYRPGIALHRHANLGIAGGLVAGHQEVDLAGGDVEQRRRSSCPRRPG